MRILNDNTNDIFDFSNNAYQNITMIIIIRTQTFILLLKTNIFGYDVYGIGKKNLV